jgi:hypothetical protein
MFATKLKLKPKATAVVSATVVSKRPPEPQKPPKDTKPKAAKAQVQAKKKRSPDPVDQRPRSERIAETLAILQAEFPRLFPETEADVRPFAIGIRNEIWEALKKKKAEGKFRSRSLIHDAIALYREQHPAYLERLKVVGTSRVGLSGDPQGAVTEAEALFAQTPIEET